MDDEAVRKRLDVLIRLILDQQLAEGKIKRKDQLLIMDSVGLTTGEMSRILGRSSKDVASHLKQSKFGRKPRKKEKNDNE